MSIRLSAAARRNAKRILPFGVIWLVLGQVFLLSDWAAIDTLAEIPAGAIRLTPATWLFGSITVAIIGLLLGAAEVFLMRGRFEGGSLTRKVMVKTSFYAAALLGTLLIAYPPVAAMDLGVSLLDARVWDGLADFLLSRTMLATTAKMSVSLVASLFYSEIGEHIGHGVLASFLSGRYHTPREEVRVFMFSDMKSSTSIAEILGHARYFDLLKSYYRTFSDPIIAHGGEVYQYIGDEIVVSWPLEAGVQDASCLRCFFAMKDALHASQGRHKAQFGVAPDFKAGLHVGPVTTGEVGALKKEIVFTGDVLNATARLQGLCADYDVDLLVSEELMALLDLGDGLRARPLGRHQVRGKQQEMGLFSVARPEGLGAGSSP